MDVGLLAGILTSRLSFGSQGWVLVCHAMILAFMLGFGPRGWDLGLEAGIWASRLEFWPRDWNLGHESRIEGGGDKGEEGEGENSPV